MDLRQNEFYVRFTSIISSLVSAVHEWMLMFMIFVNSSFAYLVTRFAYRSQLQTPCLLCSRLDHFLGNERDEFYWDLFCPNHKSKISSLVLCQLHSNLVDVHQTCEKCISSIVSVSKCEVDENIDPRKCSCCNDQWISKTSIRNLFRRKSVGNEARGLPHVEYSRIKVMSDSESDGPVSDNESGSAIPQVTSPAEKLIHLDSPVKFSHSESDDHTYLHHNVESEVPIGHRLKELQGQQADHVDDVSKPLELASSCDVHPSPSQTKSTSIPESEKEVPVECDGASNLVHDLGGAHELFKEVNKGNEIHVDFKPNKTDTSLDISDAYKLALGTRGRQLSGRLLEQQRSMTESTRASQDLKILLSQMSFARGIDLSNNVSPKVSASSEDFNGILGMQVFQRRISLERNESNLSLDGSSVSEIEGESELDRLKRQAEHDKKILISLYKELEEERNASAIATNQAMAMINRLQEEKAAFHMEALQCVRMMEEQAEYDGEALQKANEIVMEKEKLIQDIQLELEQYKNQCEARPECESDVFKDIAKKIHVKTKMADGDDTIRRSLDQFEDEKRCILECLKKFEENLSIDGSNSNENSQGSKDVELDVLRRELSVIKNRMGALEAEQDVIECSIDALRKGSEGFEFIRDIAFQLQQLHSAYILKRNEELI